MSAPEPRAASERALRFVLPVATLALAVAIWHAVVTSTPFGSEVPS